jgi:hypothetical protein
MGVVLVGVKPCVKLPNAIPKRAAHRNYVMLQCLIPDVTSQPAYCNSAADG